MAKDPVCGMEVNERTAKYTYEYGGKVYYFCRQQCLDQFKANPAKYASR
ncbi:MAG: YHS domain-containing protein [Nitrososphaerota archaeon]